MIDTPVSTIHELQRRPDHFGWTHAAPVLMAPSLQASARLNRDYMKHMAPLVARTYLIDDTLHQYAARRLEARVNDPSFAHELAETVQGLKAPVALEFKTSAGKQIAAIVSPEDSDTADFLRAGFVHFLVREEDGRINMVPGAMNIGRPVPETTMFGFDPFFAMDIDDRALYRGSGLLALNVLDALTRTTVHMLKTAADPDLAAKNRTRTRMNRAPLSQYELLQIDPEEWARIETQRKPQRETPARQVAHASGYSYDNPFVVEGFTRKDGRKVRSHAKGGSEEQRTVLNELISAGDELTLKSKLREFDSPQAERPVQVRLGKPRHTPER